MTLDEAIESLIDIKNKYFANYGGDNIINILIDEYDIQAIDMTIQASRDIEEIKEVINCDVDAETKCKMISNILTAKPHYFEESTVTPTNISGDMVCPQVDGVTPTVISNDDSYYKFVKNYNDTLPPNVHIMEIELGKGEKA